MQPEGAPSPDKEGLGFGAGLGEGELPKEEEPPKNPVLSPEIMIDIDKIFDVFQDANGLVPIHELRVVLRALDVDPIEEEMGDLIKQADPNGSQSFDKKNLISIMEDKLKDMDTVEDMIEQFKLLDRKGNGKIPNPELKQFMMTLGSKMTEEEVEELLKEADPKGEGQIDIEEFSKLLCPPKDDK